MGLVEQTVEYSSTTNRTNHVVPSRYDFCVTVSHGIREKGLVNHLVATKDASFVSYPVGLLPLHSAAQKTYFVANSIRIINSI
jgi:hypothetical protein